jgi:hypothetical protein
MEIRNFEINPDKKKPHVATFSVYIPPFGTINRFRILKNEKDSKYFWLAPTYRKDDKDKKNYPFVDFGDRFPDFRKELFKLLKTYFDKLDKELR